MSWKSGVKGYHKVTLYNKPHTRDWLGKTQEGGYLCSEGSNRELSRRQTLYRVSCGVELFRVAWDWRDVVA